MVARYLEIKLKKEQVASNECVYRGNVPLCGYPPFLVSRFQYKLGRACSSDVYSVLKTEAEVFL